MFIVCPEHLDRAIDDYIDKTGEPPEILAWEDSKTADTPPRCAYCGAAPAYIVTEPPVEGAEEGEANAD